MNPEAYDIRKFRGRSSGITGSRHSKASDFCVLSVIYFPDFQAGTFFLVAAVLFSLRSSETLLETSFLCNYF